MKSFFTCLFTISILISSYCQDNDYLNNNQTEEPTKSISQGNVIFSAYYGGPNLTGTILKTMYSNFGSSDSDPISIGPFGGTISYMVTDNIGVGVDANYTDIYIEWENNTVDSSGNDVTYFNKAGMKTIRIMPRFNFHFEITETFAPYIGVAAGWRERTYYSESTNPSGIEGDREGFNPLAFRISAGGDIFIGENIGFNLEIGLGGGGLVRGGLIIKL